MFLNPEAIELVPRLLIKARLDNGRLTVEILGRARGERARNLQVLGSQTISVENDFVPKLKKHTVKIIFEVVATDAFSRF